MAALSLSASSISATDNALSSSTDSATLTVRSSRAAEQNDVPSMRCIVCEEVKEQPRFPEPAESSKCDHSQDVCEDCWAEWLHGQVSAVAWDEVSCCQCPAILEQGEVRALASEGTFEEYVFSTKFLYHLGTNLHSRYLNSELRAALSTDEAFFWCLSPNCNSGQLNYGDYIFTCNECGVKSCTTCSVLWHEGRSCQEKTEDEQATKEARIKRELALDEHRLEAERQVAQAGELEEEEEGEANEAPAHGEPAAQNARIAEERAREEARVKEVQARKEAQLKEQHAQDEAASTTTLKTYKACPGCSARVEKARYVLLPRSPCMDTC